MKLYFKVNKEAIMSQKLDIVTINNLKKRIGTKTIVDSTFSIKKGFYK
jgi:hypothetical protein